MVLAAVLFSAGKNTGSHPRPCGLYIWVWGVGGLGVGGPGWGKHRGGTCFYN